MMFRWISEVPASMVLPLDLRKAELPDPVLNGPWGAAHDQAERPLHGQGVLGDALVGLAPEELTDGALSPGDASCEEMAQVPVSVIPEHHDIDVGAGQLLPEDRVFHDGLSGPLGLASPIRSSRSNCSGKPRPWWHPRWSARTSGW